MQNNLPTPYLIQSYINMLLFMFQNFGTVIYLINKLKL